MAKKRRKTNAYRPGSYTTHDVHADREYGFFWYEWLWKALRPALVFICATIIVIGIVSRVYSEIDQRYFMPMDASSPELVEFEITSGQTVRQISENLVDAGLLRNASVFRYIVQFQGLTGAISYGKFNLSRSMNANAIISELTSGSQTYERVIRIIPGWTINDIADYLVAEGAIASKDAFLLLANQPERFTSYSYALSSAVSEGLLADRLYALEGYLAPDTYRVFRSANEESILRTLLAQGNSVTDNIFYQDRTTYSVDEEGVFTEDEGFKSPLTMNEALTLASIIEREAGKREDYAKVSAVFYNRIAQGWRLESDATTNYALGQTKLVLSQEALALDSPYNTYARDGLPAGPICNPSSAAIEAALLPDMEFMAEGYMYFCAREPESGELAFAKTKEEQDANVALYRPSWEAFDALH